MRARPLTGSRPDGWRHRPLGHQPALDGLRALAILLVLARHEEARFVKGGFLGVDVFFVLSGFLITSLLLDERAATGSVALRAFYGRRARRLLPALCLTLVLVGVLYAVLDNLPHGIGFGWSTLAIVLYAGNWVEALRAGGLGLLSNTWSLAIEEQFYIVWPAVLLVAFRYRWRATTLLAVACSSAAASAFWRALTSSHFVGGSPYFGTPCRADGLLIGCALAVAANSDRGRALLTRLGESTLLAAAALCALALAAWRVDPFSPALYLGGFTAASLAAAILVNHVTTVPSSPLSRVLAARAARWIGRRSYGLYLFHFSIFIALTRNGVHGATQLGVGLALTFAAAAASYRWIESPFLRGKKYPRRAAEPMAEPASAGAVAEQRAGPGRPTVSVVIPAYDAWSTLPAVLEALGPQVDRAGREVLVVDSSPNADGARAELRERWPYVRLVALPERTLPGRARNIGADLAHGELVAFLDADGIPGPVWLDELEAALLPGGAGVAGAIDNGTPRSAVGTAAYLLEFSDFLPTRRKPLWHAATCNLLLRKRVLVSENGFPEDVWPGEDTLLTFGLCRSGRIAFAPEARVAHLNRTALIEFLRHQRRLGVAYGQICARLPDYPRRTLGRPALAPLAGPLRLGALARGLVGHPRWIVGALALLPLLSLGVAAWAVGLGRSGASARGGLTTPHPDR